MGSSSQRHKAAVHGVARNNKTTGRIVADGTRVGGEDNIRFEGYFKTGYIIHLGLSPFGTWLSRQLTIGASDDGTGLQPATEVIDDFIANSTGTTLTMVKLGADVMSARNSGFSNYGGYEYVLPAAHADQALYNDLAPADRVDILVDYYYNADVDDKP